MYICMFRIFVERCLQLMSTWLQHGSGLLQHGSGLLQHGLGLLQLRCGYATEFTVVTCSRTRLVWRVAW